MLHTPRLTFAMGEHGDFPGFFAAVYARFGTRYLSIVIFAVLLVIFRSRMDFRGFVVVAST